MTKGEELGRKTREKLIKLKRKRRENTLIAITVAFVLMLYSKRISAAFTVATRLIVGINIMVRTFTYIMKDDYEYRS